MGNLFLNRQRKISDYFFFQRLKVSKNLNLMIFMIKVSGFTSRYTNNGVHPSHLLRLSLTFPISVLPILYNGVGVRSFHWTL